MVFVWIMSVFFATMIVFEQVMVLGIAITSFLIMSASIGIYEAKKKGDVIIPDYSDEK